MSVAKTHSKTSSPSAGADLHKKFGTFLGVYTPSVLTILGVMMYLRFGWVVGNLGLILTMVLVVLASSITFVTGLSASAIATNMRVGVGGEYYMVSRSLGLELGGSIGIPLYLCRTLSLTLYAFGFAESVVFLWPAQWGAVSVPAIAAATIILTTAVAGKSAEASLKLQLPIMAAVGMSLVALAAGVLLGDTKAPEMGAHYERSAPEGFWYVFAVFFPAVTGFAVGIGMSGDLADPKRSIPRGTILAVVTGLAIYLLIPVLLGITDKVSPEELASLDPDAPPVWTKIALLGVWLIYPGMWGAILSSAFGSALGGPRVLQALASDGLLPKMLARTSRTGQPTIATWVTGAIALAAVALGDLNAVGRWVTVFFLTLYVTLNLAAAVESLTADPSYRPTIRVPWYVSFAGSAGAIAVMFLMSPLVCVIAVSAEVLLYIYLRRRRRISEETWGDARAGMWIAVTRYALLRLRNLSAKARNWRPQILLFSGDPTGHIGLCRMAAWLNQSRGIVTVRQVVEGHLADIDFDIGARRKEIDDALAAQGIVSFNHVDVVPDLEGGLIDVAQANGFAGLQSNTLMFGWPSSLDGLARVLRVMRSVSRIQKNTLIARLPASGEPAEKQRIDVWWRGKQRNGDLMLLFAHLVSRNPQWLQSKIVVRTIVDSEPDRAIMERSLKDLIADVRIPAEAQVLVKPSDRSIAEAMHDASHKADIVFLGLMEPLPGKEEEYAARLDEISKGFHCSIFVRNSDQFAGELI